MAPDFALVDQSGRLVRRDDFAGRYLVLYFYPRDMTPGCTTEAREFSALAADFDSLGASVVGVSPDPPERHRRFAAQHDLKVQLLSDPEHEAMQAYGAWGEKKAYGRTTVGAIRSTALIGPDGRVLRHWPKVRAKGHAAEVLAALREHASEQRA